MTENFDIRNEFEDKFYRMNPETDDLIFGKDLKNGMLVLTSDPMFRPDLNHSVLTAEEKYAGRKWSRWAIIEKLEIKGVYVRFIGVFPDGTKELFDRGAYAGWFVKKDSIPAKATESNDLRDAIQKRIQAAMIAQDALTYHNASVDETEKLSHNVADEIFKMVDREWDSRNPREPKRDQREMYETALRIIWRSMRKAHKVDDIENGSMDEFAKKAATYLTQFALDLTTPYTPDVEV